MWHHVGRSTSPVFANPVRGSRNTTTLGNRVVVFDAANRHVKSAVTDDGVTTVSYMWTIVGG